MKNIIVTGCSSGIGAETVSWLVKNTESKVIGIARRSDKLKVLAQQLNIPDSKGVFIPFSFNLSETDRFSELKVFITSHFSEIHVLINNAGEVLKKPFVEVQLHDFDSVINLNVRAPFFLIQQLIPFFAKQSHIVNITSMGGFQGSVKFPGLSVYSASKAALSNLTECLATELSEKEISFNAIAPGAVQTDMLARAFPSYKAPVSPEKAGEFIGHFAMNGNYFFNGKILPLSVSTP